ncbi:MAG: nickel pincer cofactor biosynthesis protein LarC [Angelakisella sp.]
MKLLYLDCSMGAAGDMLLAALLELHPTPESFVTKLNNLGIPKVRVSRQPAVKCGVTGTHVSVTVDGQEEHSEDIAPHDHDHNHDHDHDHDHDHNQPHHHGSMEEIAQLIAGLPVSQRVREDALAVYRLIAEAESRIHGVPVGQVHFHEVGSMDAVADIVGVSLLLEELAPQKIIASPVCVGSGQVHCAHGILPVPAPATADLLRGVPCYSGDSSGELCTPTGAALLKYFCDSFGSMPVMSIQGIGYGMGSKDFPAANCLRAMLGSTDTGSSATEPNDSITELSCNLDDMTGEAIGFACQKLLECGALDVFTLPITMKKGRPATMLTVLSKNADADRLAAALLRYTTTFGVRSSVCRRYTLDRTIDKIATPLGEIRIKTGSGYGIQKRKPEYDDLAELADQQGVAIHELLQKLGM